MTSSCAAGSRCWRSWHYQDLHFLVVLNSIWTAFFHGYAFGSRDVAGHSAAEERKQMNARIGHPDTEPSKPSQMSAHLSQIHMPALSSAMTELFGLAATLFVAHAG
jgi:hypothetical protein